MSKSADPLSRDKRGDTPLHLCCRVGDSRILSLLIRQISSRYACFRVLNLLVFMFVFVLYSQNKDGIDVLNSLEHSALYEASSLGHYPCVRRLIRAGANPTIHGPLRRTSLHVACLSGSYETLQLLLRSSYSKTLISADDVIGATPLHYAAGNALLV